MPAFDNASDNLVDYNVGNNMLSNSQLNPYQRYIAMSRYARFLPEEKRRETWEETVGRYCDYFYARNNQFPKDRIFDAILGLKVMPSMRALMTAGKALDRDEIAGYNCSYLPVDDVRAFDEALFISMCFHANTIIKTRHGGKRISDITLEDEVLTYNENNKSFEYRRPSRLFINPTQKKAKLELTFEDGYTVKCTNDHLFLTTNRGWVEAKDLTENDDIKDYKETDLVSVLSDEYA